MMTFLLRMVMTLSTFAVVWLLGLCVFIASVPTRPTQPDVVADAAVVLTGGAGRIDYGLKLLGEHKVARVFISGVNEEATPEEVFAVSKVRMQHEFPSLDESAIDIGYDATSTIGNAEEANVWLRNNGIHRFRMVTADYHIPRSIIEFQAVLPKDITMIPDPVISEPFSVLGWWKNERMRSLILSEYHKTLAAILRHLIIRLERAS